MSDLRMRQVHLDFHTSGMIDGIGAEFDPEQFKRCLKEGHVDSITLFAKCHHGYSYHPTDANEMHPGLSFDLLGAELKAAKEIGVRAPVYISAGVDEKDAVRHPEWLNRPSPSYGANFRDEAGYHVLCMNSPYRARLRAQVREVCVKYNPAEIFLDICAVRDCYCNNCLESMKNAGLDPKNGSDVRAWAEEVYRIFAKDMTETVKQVNPETAVFFNWGTIPVGRRDIASYDSHFELESLPTGGWGYDHFPMTASYCRNFGKDLIGMTGKFHTTWGEFGGFKHPNALIYETSLSLALCSGCSIGDQMHPSGIMNQSTYRLIGKAYEQVEKKEPWCRNAKAVSDAAILTGEPVCCSQDSGVGANRMLLEGHYLYDIIDSESDLSGYKLVILPDHVRTDGNLAEKLRAYAEAGGRILASGSSGFADGSDDFLGLGILKAGETDGFRPNYMEPADGNGFVNGVTQYVMYCGNRKITSCESFRTVAKLKEPYFNRTAEHFCSHQHTPDRPSEGETGAVTNGRIAYISWNIFEDYAVYGELHAKELVHLLIDELLGENRSVITENLPDRGVVTLNHQAQEKRYVNHILFAHTTKRGRNTEVIEDCVPLYNVGVSVMLPEKPLSVKTVHDGKELQWKWDGRRVFYTVPEVYIHAMVEISY